MEWQDIESAPRDGTQILVMPFKHYYQVVSWYDGEWRENTNGLALKREPVLWSQITPPEQKP